MHESRHRHAVGRVRGEKGHFIHRSRDGADPSQRARDVGLPRAKRWLYDSGTHIPLIIRVPENFHKSLDTPSLATDTQLISSVDFAPTVLNIAGIDPPSYLQGRAFLGLHLIPPRASDYGDRHRMAERYDHSRTDLDTK